MKQLPFAQIFHLSTTLLYIPLTTRLDGDVCHRVYKKRASACNIVRKVEVVFAWRAVVRAAPCFARACTQHTVFVDSTRRY